MNPIAFVPMRGGSKGIPGKNIMRIGPKDKRLFEYAIDAARSLGLPVLVSTDDVNIAEAVGVTYERDTGVFTRFRPQHLATSKSPTEDAIWWHLRAGEFAKYTHIVMMQVTNPFTTSADIQTCLTTLLKCDSAVSVVNVKQFRWAVRCEKGVDRPLYKPWNRPTRDGHGGTWLENGALYGFSIKEFEKHADEHGTLSRIVGASRVFAMPRISLNELDNPEDIPVINALLGVVKGE